jgi:hypothetical protein
MPEVIVTDEFRDWYHGLVEGHGDCVLRSVAQLEARGVSLGFPLSSAIRVRRWRYANSG